MSSLSKLFEESEVHLRHGFQIEVQGLDRNEPTYFEILIKKVWDYSVELTVRLVGLNVFSTDDLADRGITIKMIQDKLMDRSIQKSVIECMQHGCMPHLNGKTYSWIPKVQVEADGSVFITIKAGRVVFTPRELLEMVV